MKEHVAPTESLDLGPACRSFVDILRHRARTEPGRRAFVFLEDGAGPERTLTYGELDERARAIGAVLQRTCPPGERALLVYPPGLDLVAAFFGCLYAGVVAVPAYPPEPSRLARTLPRFQAIAADARATLLLTTADFAAMAPALAPFAPDLAALTWLSTDAAPAAEANAWRDPDVTPETLAFLQYTSGSTGVPKGVMVSHLNLLHNSAAHHRLAQHTPRSVHVSWLPCYHDMGLINGILQPVFGGLLGVLMPPLAFLKHPVRWLEAISRYGGTTSPFPNFALDLCVRKVRPEALASLDLSTWKVACNGAEPLRADTLDRFDEVFGPRGFRRETHFPAYGLAEATVLVTGGKREEAPKVLFVIQDELEQHRVRLTGEPCARALVGSGQTIDGQEVAIVDPETRMRCPADRVGEIWVTGPSVAQGYWDRPDDTKATFQARIAGEPERPYLRTGDLGFLHEGELFVTGRRKDLIVLRGRNVYPHDLEQAIEGSHPALRPGGSAAFSIEEAGEEAVVLAAEVERGTPPSAVEDIARAARVRIAERCGLSVRAIVLLPPGALPKTSSGKIQRSTCRELYLSRQLEAVGESVIAPAAEPTIEVSVPAREALAALAPPERRVVLAGYVRARLAAAFRVPLSAVEEPVAIEDLGADSLKLMNLAGALESDLGVRLSPEAFLGTATVGDLVDEVLGAL